MITTITRRLAYRQRGTLRIECPSCSTAYSAARLQLLADQASATIVCMVCGETFDVEISVRRTLLGKSLQTVTRVRG